MCSSDLYDEELGEIRRGFSFVELQTELDGRRSFQKFSRSALEGKHAVANRVSEEWENIDQPSSNFGIAWDDVSTVEDRKYWVAASHLRIFDLSDSSIVAERIGYFIEAGFGSRGGARNPWLTSRGPKTTCPQVKSGYEDAWFVSSVLEPTKGE